MADIITCGVGTTRAGDQCKLSAAACGTDTYLASAGTSCVSRLFCGANTTRSGDACVGTGATCGANTTLSNGQCVVASSACGAGTTLVGGRCEVQQPSGELTGFLSSQPLYLSFYNEVAASPYNQADVRIMITDMSQSGADAWTQALAKPIGQGRAFHLRVLAPQAASGSTAPLLVDEVYTMTVLAPANCATGWVGPDSSYEFNDWKGYANFFTWSSTTATPSVCARGGSVALQRLNDEEGDRVKVTLNIEFQDGTLWQDRVFSIPYRRN